MMINTQKHKVTELYEEVLKKRHPAYQEAQKVIETLDGGDVKINKKLIEKERSKITDHLQFSEKILEANHRQVLEAIRSGPLKENTLDKLDKIQRETMKELQFYSKQQETLQ